MAEATATQDFIEHLPGAMQEFAASEDGGLYDTRVLRAQIDPGRSTSMSGRLAIGWDDMVAARSPADRPQLLEKYAVQIFDSATFAQWLSRRASGEPLDDTPEGFRVAAAQAANSIVEQRPWEGVEFLWERLYYHPFHLTPFAKGIHNIMNGIKMAVDLDGHPEAQQEAADVFFQMAVGLGGVAANAALDPSIQGPSSLGGYGFHRPLRPTGQAESSVRESDTDGTVIGPHNVSVYIGGSQPVF